MTSHLIRTPGCPTSASPHLVSFVPVACKSISPASRYSILVITCLIGLTPLLLSSSITPPALANYQPPRREMPLRTESAGVRLSEEICSDRGIYQVTSTVTLTHKLLKMTDQIRTLVPPSMQLSSQSVLRERC